MSSTPDATDPTPRRIEETLRLGVRRLAHAVHDQRQRAERAERRARLWRSWAALGWLVAAGLLAGLVATR